MAILFAGGEDSDFSIVAAQGTYTAGGAGYRAGYARAGIIPSGVAGSVRALNQFSTSNLWFTARIYPPGGQVPGVDWLRFLDAANRPRVVFNGAGGTLQFAAVFKVNAAGARTNLGTFTIAVPANQLTKLDVHLDYSANGSIACYYNGTLVFSYSGDMTTDGFTGPLTGFDFAAFANGGSAYWSEMIVADQDTRSMSLVTLPITGNGATMQWNGSYTTVNEQALNDSNGIDTALPNQIEEFTIGTIPTGTFAVLAVLVAARASTFAGAPQHLDLGLKLGGTDYWSPDQALDVPLQRIKYQWNTNPATNSGWLLTDLAGMGMALKSVA